MAKIAINCFFNCGFKVTRIDDDQEAAHSTMEKHYRTNHRPQISAFIHDSQVQARKD